MTIIKPGPSSILQDLGRKGIQHLGFCASGAADEHAYLWANKLLQNAADSAALEITLGPFECRFNAPTFISLTGAANACYLNGNQINTWQSIGIHEDDVLHIDAPRQGLRTYLAIDRGFHFSSVFDSAAMVAKEDSGPYGGKPFYSGQELNYLSTQKNLKTRVATPAEYIPDYSRSLTCKVFLSPEHSIFPTSALYQFFNSPYTITPNANRMGYRLSGDPIKSPNSVRRYSKGTPFGAIQVPPNGQPIILLKDRQTIGGYPIIGCISHMDGFALSQMRPGQTVTFENGSIVDSQLSLSEFYAFFL